MCPSRAVLAAWLLGLVAGCAARGMPSALSLPQADEAPSHEIVDRTTALVATLRGDPLARRPDFPSLIQLEALGDATALRFLAHEVSKMERDKASPPDTLRSLATRWAGTEVEAITAGYRLGLAERLVGAHANAPTHPDLHELTYLLTPIRRPPEAVVFRSSPLEVLAPRPSEVPSAAIRAAERSVLRAWLAGPDVPATPVAQALQHPTWTRLASSRIGRLLIARAGANVAPIDPAAIEDLRLATQLALQRAAADRASEQGRWSDRRRVEAERLNAEDPIVALLQGAFEALLPSASLPSATGAALVALEALRLEDACDLPPCRGLFDRTRGFESALIWSPEWRGLIELWQVIAVKQALDGLEVSQDTVRYPFALADMIDGILGTGGQAIRSDVLTERPPGLRVWSGLAAAVGEPGSETWEDARVALGRHLADLATRATAGQPAEVQTTLQRIAARSVP